MEEYFARAAEAARWRSRAAAAGSGAVKWLCVCCGLPTLDELDVYEVCYLCDWEEDVAASRLPDEAVSPNGAFSLNDARGFFTRYLTRYPAHDRKGLIEFYPEVRELRRLIVRLYTLMFASDEPSSFGVAIEEARKTLVNVRTSLTKTRPDFSEESGCIEDVDDRGRARALFQTILNQMFAFSDRSFQEAVWVRGDSQSGFVQDYPEAMEVFREFTSWLLADDCWELVPLGSDQVDSLKRFSAAIENFDEHLKVRDAEHVLAEREWAAIVARARQTLESLVKGAHRMKPELGPRSAVGIFPTSFT